MTHLDEVPISSAFWGWSVPVVSAVAIRFVAVVGIGVGSWAAEVGAGSGASDPDRPLTIAESNIGASPRPGRTPRWRAGHGPSTADQSMKAMARGVRGARHQPLLPAALMR
jgi:hypothetical protein